MTGLKIKAHKATILFLLYLSVAFLTAHIRLSTANKGFRFLPYDPVSLTRLNFAQQLSKKVEINPKCKVLRMYLIVKSQNNSIFFHFIWTFSTKLRVANTRCKWGGTFILMTVFKTSVSQDLHFPVKKCKEFWHEDMDWLKKPKETTNYTHLAPGTKKLI